MSEYRIAIVDPDAASRAELRGLLEAAGCLIVGEAESVADAVQISRAQRPHLSFVDLALIESDAVSGENALEHLEGAVLMTLDSDAALPDPLPDWLFGCIGRPYQKSTVLASFRIAAAWRRQFARFESELESHREILETRKVVARAKRLLMELHEISEEEAYRRVQQRSMNSRMSLRAVAEAIIESHTKKG